MRRGGCPWSTEFANQIGCQNGVSGYVYRTVPMAIHAWLSFPSNYQAGVSVIIRCGGDTDSTAAIAGAIIGSGVGRAGIPSDWITGIREWPRSISWLERLAKVTAQVAQDGSPQRPPEFFPMSILPRNLFFLGVVLGHVVRRTLPPF